MKPGTFDTLTKTLANTTSRRGALRRIAGMLFGGTVGGVALAELTPGVALADGGNSDCAHFCNAIFAPGDARGQCKDDAAHGRGLCYTCGPKASGGSVAICCPTDAGGQCTSYSSATCCGSGQTCTNGTCVASCAGVVLSNGTCATDCSQTFTCSCGFCANDSPNVNNAYCTDGQNLPGVCEGDNDCPSGYFCETGFPPAQTCWHAVVC